MSNATIKGAGPGFIGDLARMGGDVTGAFTSTTIQGTGPGFLGDLARMGGKALVSPSITGTPVLTGTENAAYTGFTVSAVGGEPAYTYALVGTWPTGISINSSTGAVTGTPTEGGSFTGLSVKVTDSDSEVAQLATFTLEIEAAGG